MNSSNKKQKKGYRQVHVVYDDDDIVGAYEDILTNYSKRSSAPKVVDKSSVADKYVSPVDDFWNTIHTDYDFVPDKVLCFGFRRKCATTRRYILNNLATVMSTYIHCEVFFVSTRNMYGKRNALAMLVTEETKRLILRNHIISQTEFQGDERKWDFVWTRMNTDQYIRMKEAVYHLVVHEQHRVFSRCNIWCFCIVSCFPNYNTRTCSESTLLFIQRVYSTQPAANPFAYTPSDVCAILGRLPKTCIIDALNNVNPTSTDPAVVSAIELGINNVNS